MKPRERELATIRRELTDRIATDAICVEPVEEIAYYLGITIECVPDALGLDGRLVSAPYIGEVSIPAHGVSYTEWGTPNTGDYGSARAYPLAAVSSVAEIEGYAWPVADDYDYQAAAGLARAWSDQYAIRGPYWWPLFCRVCDLVGMEDAMVMMRAEPLLFEAVLEQVTLHTLAFCERLLDACGDAMPIFCLGDDFATQRGLMIAPESWRRFLKPRYARLFALGKQRGKFIWFHSCGDITAVLPDLVDLGVDVWETVQLHTLPLSPRALKQEYGAHLTFFGGISTQQLPFVTPEEVRAEVLRCIEALGDGGGYICGPDHHIKPDVPPANTVALFEAARAFRRAGYTL